MSILDQVKIGNSVQVNLNLSKDRLTKETIEAINFSSKCVINDFKITDGKGIGVILLLSNGKEEWFFENEIEILDEMGNIIEKEKINKNSLLFEISKNLNYKPKNKINELINPLNFITWLVVAVKDIF